MGSQILNIYQAGAEKYSYLWFSVMGEVYGLPPTSEGILISTTPPERGKGHSRSEQPRDPGLVPGMKLSVSGKI
jgi:hypothetical protein